MTILVTGGAGFIGSHLVDRLLAEGRRVICFDTLDTIEKWENVRTHIDNPLYKVVGGSISDIASLSKAFSCWGIDAVVHLAAQAGVRPLAQDPCRHFNINACGTVNVLEQCRQNAVAKIIYASTSAVYGNNLTVPSKETDTTDSPLCVYAASKKAGELACRAYHALYGMDVAVIRLFTVYGPRQRSAMAIPMFTRSIYDGKEIVLQGGIEVYRDFTYVADVVSGIMGILYTDHGYEIYNLGSGEITGLKTLILALEERIGKKAITKRGPIGDGEATRTYADISKAREAFGYAPKFGIYAGLDEYVKWFLEDRKLEGRHVLP